MKNFIITLCAILPLSMFAQIEISDVVDIETDENVKLEMINPAEPVKESKKERKEREKKIRELNDDIAYAKASNSLRRGYFVLIADNIQIGSSAYRQYGVSPNTNFVLVQDEDGVIQITFNTGRPGVNGLGGWTGKGTVRNKRIKYDDNGDVHYEYQLISGKTNAEVYITLYHNSKRAVAYIKGGVSITIYGEILPYRDKDHR